MCIVEEAMKSYRHKNEGFSTIDLEDVLVLDNLDVIQIMAATNAVDNMCLALDDPSVGDSEFTMEFLVNEFNRQVEYLRKRYPGM